MSRGPKPPRSLGRRILRRTLWTLGGLFTLLVVLGIVGAIVGPPPESTPARQSTTTAAAPPPAAAPVAAPPPAPVAAPAPPAAPPPPLVVGAQVARVIDGDTFELTTGQRVRALGIDSCEMSTDAGPRAKQAAEAFLASRQVALRQQPGVDTDPYGRLLRYVTSGPAPGLDMGEYMVPASHTAVYAGGNDAAPAYVADLQARDGGRTCDDPTPPPPPVIADDDSDDDSGDDSDRDRRGSSSASSSDDDSSSSRGSSSSGGGGGRVGRDGDGDGLCNESTIPVPC